MNIVTSRAVRHRFRSRATQGLVMLLVTFTSSSVAFVSGGTEYRVPTIWPDSARVPPKEYFYEFCVDIFAAVRDLPPRTDSRARYSLVHMQAKAPVAVMLHLEEDARAFIDGMPPVENPAASSSAVAQCRARADSTHISDLVREADDVPATVEEALQRLELVFGPEFVTSAVRKTEAQFMNDSGGDGTFTWIVDNWGLHGPSPLRTYMEPFGYSAGFDMSDSILQAFWLKQHRKPLRIRERGAELVREKEAWQRKFKAEATRNKKGGRSK